MEVALTHHLGRTHQQDVQTRIWTFESYAPLCGPAEVNVRNVGEEGDGRQIVHRAGEEILLTAILLHQREGLIRVKEDLIGCYKENAGHHALKNRQT